MIITIIRTNRMYVARGNFGSHFTKSLLLTDPQGGSDFGINVFLVQ